MIFRRSKFKSLILFVHVAVLENDDWPVDYWFLSLLYRNDCCVPVASFVDVLCLDQSTCRLIVAHRNPCGHGRGEESRPL